MMMNRPDGLILLNKPSGITSFSALGRLKKELGTGKVGHTGTLDKFAEGLMIVLSGKMTRLVPMFTGLDKTYEAIICFGVETDTLDPEGKAVFEAPVPEYKKILESVEKFKGKILQKPPEYSAIHIQGKRAYERVRSGEDFQIPEREVEIFSFDLEKWDPPFLSVRIHCSKGTYIRSLARDLARICGSRAHLSELRRISVGSYHIDQAVFPENFQSSVDLIKPWSLFDNLPSITKLIVENSWVNDIKTGKPKVLENLEIDPSEDRDFALFSESREMLALVKCREGRFSYGFVY